MNATVLTPAHVAPHTLEGTSFADMLSHHLGSTAWQALHHAIRLRFHNDDATSPLMYRGIMEKVECSLLGSLLAKILKPLAVLPEGCHRNLPFEFTVAPGNDVVLKTRRYFMKGCAPFTFKSRFREKPFLHEEFRFGVGMKLQLQEEQGDLIFHDQGYFLHVYKLWLPLPRWLSIGAFELLHHNISDEDFQVIIRVVHPLFGLLFYQRGTFRRVPEKNE